MIPAIIILAIFLLVAVLYSMASHIELVVNNRKIGRLEAELKVAREKLESTGSVVARQKFWEQFVCGCGHHYAYHDRTSDVPGECEHAVGVRDLLADAVGQRFKELVKIERPCRCQGYVGPLPPSPLPTTFHDVLELPSIVR